MSEILLVNPRRRRRRSPTKKRATRRRRRRNPGPSLGRQLSTGSISANPRRRRRRSRKRNPIRARRRSRRRNPLGFKAGSVKSQVMAGATGAAGALALDVALAYIPVPPMLKAGIPGKVMKGVAAIGLGIVANRFLKVSASNATKLAEGALTVQFHGIGREVLAQFAPGVALSAYLNDEFDAATGGALGYAGSGWNPSVPYGWQNGNPEMGAYMGPGYTEPAYDSSDED